MKTAINAVVPIEPFKLFYKIEKGVTSWTKQLQANDKDYEKGTDNRLRGAGLSQLGYACFWPDGG